MNLNKSQKLWLGIFLQKEVEKFHDEFRRLQAYFKENKAIEAKKLIELAKLTDYLINGTEILIEIWKEFATKEQIKKNMALAKSNLDIYYEAREFINVIDEDDFIKIGIRI